IPSPTVKLVNFVVLTLWMPRGMPRIPKINTEAGRANLLWRSIMWGAGSSPAAFTSAILSFSCLIVKSLLLFEVSGFFTLSSFRLKFKSYALNVKKAETIYASSAIKTTGILIFNIFRPDAFIAVISLSLESLLNVIRTAMRNDIGMMYIRNDGMMNIINFMTIASPTPWLITSSTSLSVLLKSDVMASTAITIKKGTAISLNM